MSPQTFVTSTTVEFQSIHQSQVTDGYWWKAWTVTLIHIWQFLPKFWPAVHMDLNFALVVHCCHQFHSKHGQNCLASSHVWQNFSTVTVLQARWRNKNFVRWVTVTEGRQFDQNSTVVCTYTLFGCSLTSMVPFVVRQLMYFHSIIKYFIFLT